ncbi:hypothetical protein BDN72DRAFT_778656, partial [Pluteus cervinus]
MADFNVPVARRVLATPELLRNIFFSLNHCDNYRTALVCRAWSEIALDALLDEVDDICALFNLLAPLKSSEVDGESQLFVRCPTPQDWTNFEKYSRRVKSLTVECTALLPSASVFDDIGRTRIRQEILPNMWTLRWLSDLSQGVLFLHSGIRDLSFRIAVFFIRTACFFGRNITGLKIASLGNSVMDFQPVGCFEAELSTMFAQLQHLQEVSFPRFWLNATLCRVLGQLPRLTEVDFEWEEGYGNPLDTVTFNPISGSEAASEDVTFPSLTNFGQSAPFSEVARFLASWQGSCRLKILTLASQILESADDFHSALVTITNHCPQLTWLALTCLITPYRHHPRPASQPRITLDTLFLLHKLKHLDCIEISHTLPFALSNEDFLILVREWSQMETLCFGYDP